MSRLRSAVSGLRRIIPILFLLLLLLPVLLVRLAVASPEVPQGIDDYCSQYLAQARNRMSDPGLFRKTYEDLLKRPTWKVTLIRSEGLSFETASALLLHELHRADPELAATLASRWENTLTKHRLRVRENAVASLDQVHIETYSLLSPSRIRREEGLNWHDYMRYELHWSSEPIRTAADLERAYDQVLRIWGFMEIPSIPVTTAIFTNPFRYVPARVKTIELHLLARIALLGKESSPKFWGSIPREDSTLVLGLLKGLFVPQDAKGAGLAGNPAIFRHILEKHGIIGLRRYLRVVYGVQSAYAYETRVMINLRLFVMIAAAAVISPTVYRMVENYRDKGSEQTLSETEKEKVEHILKDAAKKPEALVDELREEKSEAVTRGAVRLLPPSRAQFIREVTESEEDERVLDALLNELDAELKDAEKGTGQRSGN